MRPHLEIYAQRRKSTKTVVRWSWRLKAANHQIIATPERSFKDNVLATRNVAKVKWAFGKGEEAEISSKLVRAGVRSWRWKMVVAGKKVCGPHESFTSRSGAVRSVRTVRAAFRRAKITVTFEQK